MRRSGSSPGHHVIGRSPPGRLTAYQGISLVVALTYGSMACAPQPGPQANSPLMSGCRTTLGTDGTKQDVVTYASNGGTLTVFANQATLEQVLTFEVDGQLYARIQLKEGANQSTEAHIDYGPLVPGVSHADFVVTGSKMTGAIDGRAMVPVDPGAGADMPSFQDGKPAPATKVSQEITKVVQRLAELASHGRPDCGGSGEGGLEKEDFSYSGNMGEFNSPIGGAACGGCIQNCFVSYLGCAGVGLAECVGQFAIPLVGPILGAYCVYKKTMACRAQALTCQAACMASTCCPITCGALCCDGNSVCLNSTTGACCPVGETQVCSGQCCLDGDQCMSPKAANGNACCAVTQKVCSGPPTGHSSCCDNGDSCTTNGDCCEPTFGPPSPCGTGCCNRATHLCQGTMTDCCPSNAACGSDCCFAPDLCVNPAAGDPFCCPPLRACDNTCCGSTEVCIRTPYDGDPMFCCPDTKQACGLSDCCNDSNNCMHDPVSGKATCCGENDTSTVCIDPVDHTQECCPPGISCVNMGGGHFKCDV